MLLHKAQASEVERAARDCTCRHNNESRWLPVLPPHRCVDWSLDRALSQHLERCGLTSFKERGPDKVGGMRKVK